MAEQQETERRLPHYLDIVSSFLTWVAVVTGVAVLLSLLGIVFGAINYVAGPITYPGGVLAAWFVIDVLLLVCVILYLIFFANLWWLSYPKDPGPAVIGVAGAVVVFVSGGIFLSVKHLAWISFFAFFLLLACLIVDVLFLKAWLARIRQGKDEQTEETEPKAMYCSLGSHLAETVVSAR
jgi:hypothetical protein